VADAKAALQPAAASSPESDWDGQQNGSANSARGHSPLTAANATFAFNPALLYNSKS